MKTSNNHDLNVFSVKQLSNFNLLAAILFACLSICFFFFCIEFSSIIFLIISVLFGVIFYKFFSSKANLTTLVLVNCNGIYSYGKLITSWKYYIKSVIERKENYSGDIEYVSIKVYYYKPNQVGHFVYNISFDGFNDKSENDTIEAIKSFYNNYIISLN